MTLNSKSVQVAAVLLLALFWAINWPIMKIGLDRVEPWTFRSVLVVVGGVGCLIAARLMGQSIRIPAGDVRALLWLSVFQGALWNAFSGFGIAMIDASRAAVIGFTMPVWATLLSILVLGEALTLRRLSGLTLGVVALGLLMVPVLDNVTGAFWGALLMLAGAMCWGVATVIVKAQPWEMNVMALSGWQFLIGSVPLIAAACFLGDPSTLLDLDARSGWALAYSALIPMIFCQAIWFTIVRRLPTVLASTSTLLVPPLGVLSAAVILGEEVLPLDLVALVLVILAMTLILPGFNWRAILRRPPRSRPE